MKKFISMFVFCSLFLAAFTASALRLEITRVGSLDGIHYNYVHQFQTGGFFSGITIHLDCKSPGNTPCEFVGIKTVHSASGEIDVMAIEGWVHDTQITQGITHGKAMYAGDILVTWTSDEDGLTHVTISEPDSNPLDILGR